MALNAFDSASNLFLSEFAPSKLNESTYFQPVKFDEEVDTRPSSTTTIGMETLTLADRVSAVTVDLFGDGDRTPRGTAFEYFQATSTCSSPARDIFDSVEKEIDEIEIDVEAEYFTDVPSPPPIHVPAKKKTNKSVQWNSNIMVVLIPKKEEFFAAKLKQATTSQMTMALPKKTDLSLGDIIWWKSDDYEGFKVEAKEEILPIIDQLKLNPKNIALSTNELMKKALNILINS